MSSPSICTNSENAKLAVISSFISPISVDMIISKGCLQEKCTEPFIMLVPIHWVFEYWINKKERISYCIMVYICSFDTNFLLSL